MATDFHDTVTQAVPLPGAGPQMRMVEVALIEESRTNPRKYFDPAKLQELADSIKATGVHQPILLRPLPGHRVPDTWGVRRQGGPLPAYELVAGARRLRACRLAQVAEVPAMIRELTDEQALEIQVVENLQREDVTPLEEAEGYEALMQHGHADADAVAAKIGKSRSYVYARLKLLALAGDCRQALAEGKIDASRALRIARIPDARLQAKALAEASRTNYRGDPAMGVREFEAWLQQNVMLRLEHAPFSITAPNLVEGAGSCKDCPRRTGAEPDLFADVNSPDLCTDQGCYAAKSQAHADVLRAQAEAKGMRVVEGKEAKAIVHQYRSGIDGYTRLDTVRADLQGHAPASLRELLGSHVGSEGGIEAVLIENPYTRELIEAVPTEQAEALLLQRGLLQTTQSKIDVEEQIERMTRQSKKRQVGAALTAVEDALLHAAHATPSPATALQDAELLREWLRIQVIGAMGCEEMMEVFGMEEADSETYNETTARTLARLDRASDEDVQRFALAYIALARHYDTSEDEIVTPMHRAAGRVLGVDVQAVVDEAMAEEQAELKEAIANLRRAAQPPEPAAAPKGAHPHGPAAPARPVRGGGKAKKAPAARADAEQPKTSAAHASAQIAEALAALEGEPIQAPAAQGDEAPPVPDGQAAASAAPEAGAPLATPAPAGPGLADAPRAQADACRAAPDGEGGADVSDGAAAVEGQALRTGQTVRVLPSATGARHLPYVGMTGVLRYLVGNKRDTWRVAFPGVIKRGDAAVESFKEVDLEVIND